MGIRTPERFYTLRDFQSRALDQLSHLSILILFCLAALVERSTIIPEKSVFVKPFLKIFLPVRILTRRPCGGIMELRKKGGSGRPGWNQGGWI